MKTIVQKRPGFAVLTIFKRQFVSGMLEGLVIPGAIKHVDRWHAAQWLKGIRRNSRAGRLEYRIFGAKTLQLIAPSRN